jgi:hypothetical protein
VSVAQPSKTSIGLCYRPATSDETQGINGPGKLLVRPGRTDCPGAWVLLYLSAAINRTSKLAFTHLQSEANRYTASDILRTLAAFVPYKIHTALTDNGVQFCHAPLTRSGPTALYSRHMFNRVCQEHGIEHSLTKPNHPWINGQVERMNRTIKGATVKRYHYESDEQLQAHLQLLIDAYHHACRLKTLRDLTPTSISCRSGRKSPNASGSTRHTTSRDYTGKKRAISNPAWLQN